MEYNVEELSPVKRKVNVQVPAEEVNAAIDAAIVLFKKDLKLSGFRKGKVPTYIVESRFKDEIYRQAETDLLNVHFNEILSELNLRPVSELNLDSKEFKRNTDYNYSFTFEIKPEIDLPEYHGLKAKQRKVEIKDEQVDRALENLRLQYSKLEVVKEDRKPQKGDVVVVSFKLFDGDKFLKDVSRDFFEFYFGVGDALEDFEKIVAELKPGQKGEGEVKFPEDFINKEIAGKTLRAEVELNAIKERVLPEVNEDFARRFGMDSVEELKERLRENLKKNIEDMEKSLVQKKLLDMILEKVEVVLPESMVNKQIDIMIDKEKEKLERQGKDPSILGSEEELREKFREEAEQIVKSQLVLLEIAEKEELVVTNEEVDRKVAMTAMNMGIDPQSLREFYIKNNMMFALRDSILADKAMEKVYEYADIEYIEEEDEEKVEKGEEKSSAEEEKDSSQGSGEEN